MTLPSAPPDSLPPNHGRLSKVAGAGLGGVIVVVAGWLNLSPNATLILQASAPAVAVFIGAVGPAFNRVLTNGGKWIGLQFTLKRAAALARSMPEGSEGRKGAEANIEQIHALLNDLIRDTYQLFRPRK